MCLLCHFTVINAIDDDLVLAIAQLLHHAGTRPAALWVRHVHCCAIADTEQAQSVSS
jgi:hypothetical protein